jgi:hypothetical protein
MQGLPASYIQVNLNLVLGTRSEKRNLVHAQHSSGIWYCAQGLKKGTWYMHRCYLIFSCYLNGYPDSNVSGGDVGLLF